MTGNRVAELQTAAMRAVTSINLAAFLRALAEQNASRLKAPPTRWSTLRWRCWAGTRTDGGGSAHCGGRRSPLVMDFLTVSPYINVRKAALAFPNCHRTVCVPGNARIGGGSAHLLLPKIPHIV
jgi:hypothetical protein